MTREEAIAEIKYYMEHDSYADAPSNEACQMAINALRPISRERVEGIRGEWIFPIFAGQEDANDPRFQCSECGSIETPLARHRFCPSCGAPMTDEAMQMVMERLNKQEETKK